MAATKRHACVDVYMPMWFQFCQLVDLLELWARKNKKKKRTWRQKEGYTIWNRAEKKGMESKKDNKKRRKTTSNPDHSISFFSLILQALNVFIV